ncbi:tRNA (adenosine(37)-N6)-dimethylallyltransferase MiaA [Virgibacillus siamensis]|uniref:tRNA (adenosine(37)-N6)-dimethylallyltransferase MiaA n=1 Tax=Virgibacillus siamensis TaxID=480071 RepID=UPI000985296D|nr:tRNA (adenosine(37)-N6)-dimethylallyltransferase MiaA [Virgibacillus siamensis]
MKKTVIAVVGPTAVGKTRLSLEIAKTFNGEVISGDSMQVFKGMDIGTAKITSHEMKGIPHYMIDIKNPDEPFSVADFQNHVQHHIDAISSRSKLPIIAGGSGLYIQGALYNYNFSEQPRDAEVTDRLERQLNRDGAGSLYNRLKITDPQQAAKIHPNNHRRVIRALEIFETTGKTMTEYQNEQVAESLYNPILIGLEMDRELLYKRINLRVDEMINAGLIEEAEYFYRQGLADYQSMKGIGYKEFIPYFKNEQTLDKSVELLKRNSRRYAKRQYTWFKNKMHVNWYEMTPETIEETFRKILRDLAGMLEEI